MNSVGHFDTPFVRHADKVTYVCASCCMLCGTEGGWGLMERYNLVCWAKLYKTFYFVKDADD